ncbi:MFS general substrate transporter [Setomelanomma holmii]|uniref:MFS general substrate transporter n=1 Tax=Setomelanomma holmii TaxID=210430 RepID=A0A9P4GYS2_9PLEO|nr:MFS general substrate transporter [Setomelanomma holmii]
MAVLSDGASTLPVKVEDPFLVGFNPSFDVENPKDWPTSRKWAVTDVLSATGFNRIMVSTIMAPALTTIAYELHMNSAESVIALSIYLLATAFGPLVIGPLSEVYGRKKVLHASNVWFLIWNIVCGFANTKEVLIAARFLAGFGASSIYALAGGVLTDVWRPEQRGRSLSTYLLIPLLGAAVGPIIGGFMAFRTTWRWMFWSTSIFQAVMIVVSFTVFRETYAPTILARRVAELRKDTGNARYYTEHERLLANRSVLSIIWEALSRPLRLLMFHPIIQIDTVISAFDYGVLYIVLASFANLWVKQYGTSVEMSGLHYIAIALGEIAGSQLGAPIMDHYYRTMQTRHPDGELGPEHRIPLTLPGAIIGPLGLFMYGWAAQYHLHWAVVDLGIFIACFGMQTRGMAMQAYVMDAYVHHTSSAMAATQLFRSLAAFLFPLFTPVMYAKMGYGWGNSALAFAGLALGLPASLALWYFGPMLRKRMPSSV